jgi:hypothetical protein
MPHAIAIYAAYDQDQSGDDPRLADGDHRR